MLKLWEDADTDTLDANLFTDCNRICFLVSLGQIAFGYPASIIGTTNGRLKASIDPNHADSVKLSQVSSPTWV